MSDAPDMEALPRENSDGLVARLAERAESYRQSGPSAEHTAALLDEAAAEIRRLLALADFERGFRIATDKKLGEVLGRKA